MANFGEALTSAGIYQASEKATNTTNNDGKKEKGARKRLKVTRDHSERPSATTHGFFMGRKELCMEITSVLSECYSDYIGCNFAMTPTGQVVLFALFGPDTRNEKAIYRAFDSNKRASLGSTFKEVYAAHSVKFSAYTPTQDGIDTLSDLVSAGNNQKDKDGRIKNFKQFWEETAMPGTNGQQVFYGMNTPVYARVILDVDRVLREIWPKEDLSDQYQYCVSFTNYRKCNDGTDELIRIDEISRNEAQKILQFVGAVPRDITLGGVEVY